MKKDDQNTKKRSYQNSLIAPHLKINAKVGFCAVCFVIIARFIVLKDRDSNIVSSGNISESHSLHPLYKFYDNQTNWWKIAVKANFTLYTTGFQFIFCLYKKGKVDFEEKTSKTWFFWQYKDSKLVMVVSKMKLSKWNATLNFCLQFCILALCSPFGYG